MIKIQSRTNLNGGELERIEIEMKNDQDRESVGEKVKKANQILDQPKWWRAGYD